MLEGILQGLEAAISLQNLIMVVAGCLLGTFIGMLPGLGPMSIIAIMIPVAIKIGDPSAALILLAGVYYGAIFGGSTSSILINAPGIAGTVATAFDGYPMARKGLAGKALTIAAIASFTGGTIGAILLMGFAPALATVALLFHSAEYFALMIVGLSAIAAFAGTGNVAKALMMTVVGLILATLGESAQFNAPRFTMGIQDLQSGISFITLAMALFALPEALYLVLDPKRSNTGGAGGEIKDLRITKTEAKLIAPVIGRQSIQGFLIGVMPGAGATIASFLGYAVERNIAKGDEQAEFGKGSVKGLAAPETANNAACTGSFVPLLTLGIPGSGTTAILLGALIALNVTPGPRLMVDNPTIFWAVIISMYVGNVVLLILNLPLIPYIAKLLLVPRNYLIPFILFFTMMGSYIGQNNATELLMLTSMGVAATIMRFAGFPLAPMLIGFILGQMLEDNFARAMNLTDGVSFMWERPMTTALLVLAIVLIFLPSIREQLAKLRRKGFTTGTKPITNAARYVQKLIEGFQAFRKTYYESKPDFYRTLIKSGQHPDVMVIACSDSRVNPSIIAKAEPGELFIVRNVANLVPPYEPDSRYYGTSAALEYAVRDLAVSHIIVLGHSHCGGIRRLLEGDKAEEAREFIDGWMLIADLARGGGLNDEAAIRAAERNAVTVSLTNLLTFPWVRDRVYDDKLKLHGWWFDLEAGELLEHKTGGAWTALIGQE